MIDSIALAAEGRVNPSVMVTHVGGLDAAREATLAEREADLAAARARIAEQETTIADLEATVAGLEADVAARDADLAARAVSLEAEAARIEALQAEIADRKSRIEELRKTLGLAETVVAQEKDRADRLDRRIERLVADVADREEVADRRHRELERARQALTSANARIASLTQKFDGGTAARLGDNLERSVDQLEHEKAELEARLEATERERDRLAAVARDLERGRSGGDGGSTRTKLREQMADLAAEMVRLTGAVEGGASPIDTILTGTDGGGGPRPSLAERIRAVRAAAQNGAARGRAG